MTDRATLDTLTRMAVTIRELLARVRALEGIERLTTARGSFAPTLVGAGTAGTFTYGAGNLAEWTRLGNRLFFNGRVVITATTVAPVGNLTIRGWPYAGVADANMAIAGVAVVEWASVNLPANYWAVQLQFNNASSNATLVRGGTNNAIGIVAGGELAGGVYDFRFAGQYRVA